MFTTDAHIDLPGLQGLEHGRGCACGAHDAQRSRRLFTGLLAGAALVPSAFAQDGVAQDVGKTSRLAKLVPAEQVEAAAAQQYAQMMREASAKNALAPDNHPQVQRLRYIANRIVPHASPWNTRAQQWRWEVNLLGDKSLNAFCMPGGKIAFFYGILDKLQLNDDEVAAIMGHEMAHALREHARERMGKNFATRGALEIGAALFGLGDLGRMAAGMGAQLLTLKFGREDESEADIVGMELAARAGYDPQAGVTLWQKMMSASKGAPPQFLSTHPAGTTRIKDIQGKLPKVQPIFQRAQRPDRKFTPPAAKP
jgi:predicted Zn-dependent protease